MLQPGKQSDGILACARYAYRPNKLNYCGPDQNKELLEYLKTGEADGGLELILKKFETLYPYLKLIAAANKKENFFDKKISDAYWVGNELLENVKMAQLYEHLAEDLDLKNKISAKDLGAIRDKMPKGANPHHSFHVFNIWQRTGHVENPHALYTMDECRIGWGQIQDVSDEIIKVLYEPLIFEKGKLAYGAPRIKNIFYELRNAPVKKSDWISFHWSSFCEVLSPENLGNLRKWTAINLELANLKI